MQGFIKERRGVYHNANYKRQISDYESTIEYIELHYDRQAKKYIYKPVLLNGRQRIVCDLQNVFEFRTTPPAEEITPTTEDKKPLSVTGLQERTRKIINQSIQERR